MADTKLTALPSLSGANAAANDVMLIADVSATANKSMTLTELLAALHALGIAFDDLTDVTLTAPAENETLLYNGSAWVNTELASANVVVDPTDIVNSASVNVQDVLEDLDSAITTSGIPETIFDAAGDVIVASAADTAIKLAKGSNYTFLGVNGSGTVAYADARSVPQAVNTQTGTTYTLVLTDAGKLVTCSNASSITLTVPKSDTVAFPAGTVIDLAQYGAGQVTVVGATDVTVNTSSTLKTRTQWSAASLVLSATANTWFIVGDLEPTGQAINSTPTGTTYTTVLSDSEKLVTLSNTSPITLTVPANATSAYPLGTHIDIVQTNTGQVTVAGAVGVTVQSTPTLKLRARYSAATLVKVATDTWYMFGDMATS